jgi:hypothetical protein
MPSPIEISGAAFASLAAMMRAHAEEAVRLAAAEHGMALDFCSDSIPRLETVLAARSPVPENELESATLLWGAYLGEVFRRRFSGEWIMALYPRQPVAEPAEPNADIAMPALDIGGSHIYPLLKISRRLTLGPAEDVSAFYVRVAASLDARKSRDA